MAKAPAKSKAKPTKRTTAKGMTAKPKAIAKAKSGAAPKKAATSVEGIRRWLFKSEPDAFSWDMLIAKGVRGESWDGVRNFLARNNMKAMQIGDLGFFYHSNEGKEIVGIVEVCALAHPDPKDDTGTWECVDVRAVRPLPKPVTLADVKGSPTLAGMSLVTSMRLSVQPVTDAEWAIVCEMGGLTASDVAALTKGHQAPITRKGGSR